MKRIPYLLILLILASCFEQSSNKSSINGKINKLQPNWLSRVGGENLVITGDFNNITNPKILIDDKNCTDLKKISSSQLSCITPGNTQIKNAQVSLIDGESGQKVDQFNIKYVGILGQKNTQNVVQLAQGLSTPLTIKKLDEGILFSDIGNSRIVGLTDLAEIPDRDFDFSIGTFGVSVRQTSYSTEFGTYKIRDFSYENGLFMVTDTQNNRVLIFEGIPSRWNQRPKIILGQPDAVSTVANNGGISASTLNTPMSAKFINGKIYVADSRNNRILIWDSVPTTNFTPANYVLGQPGFVTSTANNGGLSASSLNNPYFVERIGNKLFVSDFNNRRVLVWNSIPISSTPADSVIGQASFNIVSSSASASVILGPGPLLYADNKLFLSDHLGNRVLVYKNFNPELQVPNGLSADIVLGQPNFTSTAVWKVELKITSQSLFRPWGLETVDGKLLVADSSNHRILIYDHLPENTTTDQHLAATDIIGQPTMSTGTANRMTMAGPRYLPTPSNAAVFEGKLLINSESNGRISVWNSIPEEDFMPADFVLGQNSFTEDDQFQNRGLTTPNASSLSTPYQILNFKDKLFVSDNSNNRILIWNNLTGFSGQPADLVIGQSDFISNAFTPYSEYRLRGPTGIDVVDDKLIVTDRGNNRFLIYDTIPTTNNPPANAVIGQPNFSQVGVNGSNPTIINGKTFNAPMNSVLWKDRYVVADHMNRRILIWRSFAHFLSGDEANSVWGQDNFTSIDNTSTLGVNRASSFMSVRVADDQLYLTDPLNGRIIIFSNYNEPIMEPTAVLGQNNLTDRTRSETVELSAEVVTVPVNYLVLEDRIYLMDYQHHRVIILPR